MGILASLFFGTFILEDVALASALALMAQGKISFAEAFGACAAGIAVGDLGLYFLGRASNRIGFIKKKLGQKPWADFVSRLGTSSKLDLAIFVSRAIPGSRLPTYLAAGLFRYSALRFTALTLVSVGLWVFAALHYGRVFFQFFEGSWLWPLALFLLSLWVLKKTAFLLSDPWARKSWAFSWRKWRHFEFWPAWFFYLPVVPVYLFLSLRYRDIMAPFYANPHVKHGGLIGESKWDFLKYLDPSSPATLPMLFLDGGLSEPAAIKSIEEAGIAFPFVLKPDVGQRGFGVRVLKSWTEVSAYWAAHSGDVILQQKSSFEREAGIFYVRDPESPKGLLFSITDKHLPYVTGDGRRSLGELILSDPRARIISATYFERHRESLDRVLRGGEKFLLAECGNHCQGAIFLDGRRLATPYLLDAIELIVRRIPDFYFGRVDIRYLDEESLKRGQNFEVIEVNGAGAEATHIWDPNTRLPDAYRTLFAQWKLLFRIGWQMKTRHPGIKQKPISFLMECARVVFRKSPLGTSS